MSRWQAHPRIATELGGLYLPPSRNRMIQRHEFPCVLKAESVRKSDYEPVLARL